VCEETYASFHFTDTYGYRHAGPSRAAVPNVFCVTDHFHAGQFSRGPGGVIKKIIKKSQSPLIMQSGCGACESPVAMNPWFK